jgi:leucyl-tRNA synthetase
LKQKWPTYDPAALLVDKVTVVVQINGKLRGKAEFPPEVKEKEVLEMIKTDSKIKSYIEGKEVVKTIFISGKLLNIVVK